MTPTTKNTRPTSIRCEYCGRPVAVAAKGRIANAHAACGAVANDMTRLEKSVGLAIEGMSSDEIAAFRKMLVGQFMSWTNGTFNPHKANGKGKRASV